MSNTRAESRLCYTAFTTAWGPMGAVAGEAGLRRVILPNYSMNDLLDLLRWDFPSAGRDDGRFEAFVELCRGFFNGGAAEFGGVQCELPAGKTFAAKVLRACRDIPYGQTRSYRRLALCLGRPEAARPVAAALGKNPLPLVIPCHRVIYSDGRVGGFSAAGGVEMKKRMLALEQGKGD